MTTTINNRFKTLASSVLVALKLMLFLTGLLLLAFLTSEAIAYFSGRAAHLLLFEQISLAHIALFYSGSFVGVLFAHYQIRKDLKRLQNNVDTDLNKISDEVKSLEDKINQIKL